MLRKPNKVHSSDGGVIKLCQTGKTKFNSYSIQAKTDEIHERAELLSFCCRTVSFLRLVGPKLALNAYFRCINKCDALKAQLGSMKVKENQPELNLVDLPTEIQDKIMMNMNCLKDLESMSEATPFLTQIAAEYEKVCLVHES